MVSFYVLGISRASHANAVSFAPFALQQQNQAQEEPGNAVISSTVKRNSTGANMLSIHYEPLKYESLKEVKRKR
ncbi:hypothetical protein EON65_25285 [archaeon]|nr:MAG: hypothetical protein EON65_25285 [archaeon]